MPFDKTEVSLRFHGRSSAGLPHSVPPTIACLRAGCVVLSCPKDERYLFPIAVQVISPLVGRHFANAPLCATGHPFFFLSLSPFPDRSRAFPGSLRPALRSGNVRKRGGEDSEKRAKGASVTGKRKAVGLEQCQGGGQIRKSDGAS